MEKNIYKIAVSGTEEMAQELGKNLPAHVHLQSVNENSGGELLNGYDALFILDRNYSYVKKEIVIPVFINEVTQTLAQLQLPVNVMRVNLWPGFAGNKVWEIAGVLTAQHESILKEFGKEFLLLPDVAGLISARVIAMIINEAYFTMEEGVSTETEIDTAMKLGTNYPYGPVEWGKKIGLEKVLELLQILAITNVKYQPASLLEKNC